MSMHECILVMNTGSSTIKFCIYTLPHLKLLFRGIFDDIYHHAVFTLQNAHHKTIIHQSISESSLEKVWSQLEEWLLQKNTSWMLKGIGHRVVHGGLYFPNPCIVNHTAWEHMDALRTLAPLHQTQNLDAITRLQKMYPNITQIACFDTSFHHTQPKLATLFALPRTFSEQGVLRYGFHGLSYEYIASVLPKFLGSKATGNVIAAHLGQGASLCALKNQQSIATTMGFTALEGLMMGTRCGSIDPGVILYLQQEKQFSLERISTLLYKESGLLGVSGISNDLRILEKSNTKEAQEAIDLFCYRAAQEIGALAVSLQGIDAIVFSAGIGEHSSLVRKKICHQLEWLGLQLDETANEHHASIISDKNSTILVSIIPTNEEYMIAKHTLDVLKVQE